MTEDDLGDITADEIGIVDNEPYVLAPEQPGADSITLDGDSGVGLQAGDPPQPGPAGDASPAGIPDVTIPIVLGADQAWQVSGSDAWPSPYGVEVDDISGASYTMALQIPYASLYTTSLDTYVTAESGGYSGAIVIEPNPNDPGDQPYFEGVTLTEGAGLDVAAPGTESGTLYAGVEEGNDYGGGYKAYVSIGTGTAPDGTLDVDNATLGGGATLTMYIDQSASMPPTPTPSTDYSQVTATGGVTLGNADLHLKLGTDSGGNCDDLVPGQVYTLISAGAISGELNYYGSPLPDGGTVTLENDCNSELAPTVEINYNTSSTPETVTATVISGGHAGDLPTVTGVPPTISVTPPLVGSPLQAATGGWSGSPTSYDYDWYSCSATAGAGCDNEVGADAPTYTPTVADVGNTIEVCVSASNGYGTSVNENCSDPTAAVSLPPVPTNTGSAPSVQGGDLVGDVLTARPGSWSSSPTFTYQWQLCGTAGQSCTNIPGATGSSYTLTSSDVGQFVRFEVTATNAGGATVGYSNIYGRVTGLTATAAPTGPTISSTQIRSALSAIAHPSSKKDIAALLKNGSFKTGFDAPSGGSLTLSWTTTVRSGKGKHKKDKTVIIASGSAKAVRAGTIKVAYHLTRTGRSLLKKSSSHLATTVTEKFKPNGLTWRSVTKKFSL